MRIAVTARMSRDDGGNAVTVPVSGVDKKGVIGLIEGSVEVRDVEVTTC